MISELSGAVLSMGALGAVLLVLMLIVRSIMILMVLLVLVLVVLMLLMVLIVHVVGGVDVVVVLEVWVLVEILLALLVLIVVLLVTVLLLLLVTLMLLLLVEMLLALLLLVMLALMVLILVAMDSVLRLLMLVEFMNCRQPDALHLGNCSTGRGSWTSRFFAWIPVSGHPLGQAACKALGIVFLLMLGPLIQVKVLNSRQLDALQLAHIIGGSRLTSRSLSRHPLSKRTTQLATSKALPKTLAAETLVEAPSHLAKTKGTCKGITKTLLSRSL